VLPSAAATGARNLHSRDFRLLRLGHRAADHEPVGAVRDRVGRRVHARLIVRVATLEADAGHHRAQPEIARHRRVVARAHDAVALRFARELHALRERVGVRLTREHGDRERDRHLGSGVGRAVVQAVDAGAQHVDTTRGVEVHEAHTKLRKVARAVLDGVRDVVELEVAKT
jgi:hypothetical protein